jgi:predicted RNA binding protein YcfA (HicA-like mRNA interferase family)
MPKLPALPARKIIRAMLRLGFVIVRQKGSHVFLQRGSDTTVVPMHDPVKKSTLKSILKQSSVTLEDLLGAL